MKRIIFASFNQGKIQEVREILADLDIEIISAREAGFLSDIKEDGETFQENAYKKAKFISTRVKEPVMADDSGLCIKALNDMPGILSARWAGKNKTGEEIIDFTLEKIKDVPTEKRTAFFKTIVALVFPYREKKFFSGEINGKIIKEKKGKAHPKLPYNSIFIPDGYKQTLAELKNEQKNILGNRRQAFLKLKDYFKNNISL